MRFEKKFLKLSLIIYLVLGMLTSCSNLEDYQKESEQICHAIVRDLEGVENREDLLAIESRLSKRFQGLVDLMIDMRQGMLDQLQQEPISHFENSHNDKLVFQLKRIYRLEGGRDIIERAQREALIRLDAFERHLAKKKQLPKK
jgi:hypothetical protein